MNRLIIILSLFITTTSLYSCQKVIDVDLNEAEPRVVVEAEINDQPGPYYVALSRTVNFDETNVFPPVTGATVVLSDNAGNSETLTEEQPGLYRTNSITGTPGRTYTLQITSSGTTYTAVSTMPQPVKLDSLNLQSAIFRDSVKNVHAYFTDLKGTENWYRLVQIFNDNVSENINVTNDVLQDGHVFDAMLFTPDDHRLRRGDSVTVILQTIDKNVFDYFRTLGQVTGGGDPGATPGNPLTNFNNGALGYFSAHAQDRKYIIIKE